ncbi:hypothetical protein YA0783_24925 [Pseudomonas corrugata]|uniref:hypothetical protein n=1 Tax=Pseudomonas corrugata TaxID=47879 RepID=UPI0018E618AA|nr:hypothetical protein [Pseudomonas corrugata]MBI6621536.1 hypothetical protein [Pseudomonas corrugata]MBI6694229.1 hypothetical protein [Pseudomonas corrugata]
MANIVQSNVSSSLEAVRALSFWDCMAYTGEDFLDLIAPLPEKMRMSLIETWLKA